MNNKIDGDKASKLGYYSLQCTLCKHNFDIWNCRVYEPLPEKYWLKTEACPKFEKAVSQEKS